MASPKTNTSPLQLPTANNGPVCLNCPFWQPTPGAGGLVGAITGNTGGECRRNPPTVHLIPGRDGISAHGIFPATVGAGWCGEHPDIADELAVIGPDAGPFVQDPGPKTQDPAVSFPAGEHDQRLKDEDDR